ncbi:Dabb family protein [bacterium]|nr:Dabb family protein [bacterium]
MLKTRKSVIVLLASSLFLTAAVGVILFNANAAEDAKKEEAKIGFIHIVFFWINEDASEADVKQLMDDCINYLGAVETVQDIKVGTPAGTPRDVVDNSYGVSLVVSFKDRAGQDYYQKAQKHLDFIERNSKTWSKVQVYDMIPK